MTPEQDDIIENAKSEIKGMAEDGMAHPSTKPVLTGAAVGAAAGLLVPGLSIIIGAVAGAGFTLYHRIKK